MSRGRRPGSPETRGAILESARESFAARGYRGTTIRSVAAEAGVDPALVHHYFGTKDDLFLAALEVPFDPRQLLPMVLAEGVDGAAERLLRTVLPLWEERAVQRPLIAIIRTSMSPESRANLLQDGLLRMILGPLGDAIGEPDGALRAELFGTQMVGLFLARHVLELEPLASLAHDEVIRWVAPNLQRYLTGALT